MTAPVVLSEYRGRVLLLTINRPEALNALNAEVIAALIEHVGTAAQDPLVRAIGLRGAGGRAFVAGADIKAMPGRDAAAGEQLSLSAHRLHTALRQCRKPVVAGIQGYALGGGLELALACDIRIGDTKAKLGLPEVTLGILPGGGGTVRLSRAIGPAAARAMVMTGEPIDASRAFALGLLTEVHEPDAFEAAFMARLDKLAGMSGHALAQIKSLLDMVQECDLATAEAAEAKALGLCFAHEDAQEGMRAFIEKRPPDFA